ncbi:type II secretion system protein [Candidatus Protochlamydia phocaeensis]|uniref:type II secretion system protein n=1 Tax=Candidatus Protochlamydia phocaeensis TaxID=1414722 RepID=UPI0008398699|nr:type II secretion system protein [Candidatus Protochlamydia phocaeensis]
MKKFAFKKRFVTLVEMMIVMFLIAMITGVIAYNYTGSLDEGKAFKTKAGIEKIHTILDLHLASHPEDKESLDTNWKGIVERSQLVKNPKELLKDGWGAEYDVSTNQEGDIEIRSGKYEAYQSKKGAGSLFNK